MVINKIIIILRKKSNYKNNFYCKIIILIIIYLFLIIIYFLTIKLFKTRNNFSRTQILTYASHYLKMCLSGKLINNKKIIAFELPKEIKISIIVPIYNSYKTIKAAIRSIQNQKMKDIEIILINDHSKDNSTKIVKEMKEEDKRIKLLNNNKNMGILYSRCRGVLEAKGKYILTLDQDDMFFNEDLFDIVYEEAEKGNYDIISFIEVKDRNYHFNVSTMVDGFCTKHPDNLIIKQPELSFFPFFRKDRYYANDIPIWGKLFETKVYKNAIKLLGNKRYSVYNIINEDQIMLYAICIIAQSYKFIREYGLFHLVNNPSASYSASKDHNMKMRLFFNEVIFDLSKNEFKKYAAIFAISISKYWLVKISNKNKIYLIKIINKIINSKYINEEYKKKLIKKYKILRII